MSRSRAPEELFVAPGRQVEPAATRVDRGQSRDAEGMTMGHLGGPSHLRFRFGEVAGVAQPVAQGPLRDERV
jgi:hypothetical protein